MSLSERLKVAAIVEQHEGTEFVCIGADLAVQIALVLEAAEAWAKAIHAYEVGYNEATAQHMEQARATLLAALAAHGPSQDKERT